MSQTANAYERPTWSLPNGNVPDIVANYYFRSDTPSGRSSETPPPEAVEAFRNLVRAGAIVPTNQAAQAMVQSEGGIQNGDMSPFGVPWIDDLPGGMDAAQWNALTARSAQEADEALRQAQLSGYFNGVPTLERQQIEQQYRLQEFQNATARQLADAQIRQSDVELQQAQQALDDARRTGDLNRAAALQQQLNQLTFEREQLAQQNNQFGASLGEQARQFDIEAQQFQQTFGEGARQFDLTTAEGQRQFNLTFGEDARRFDLTTAEGQRQFNATFGEQARQFNQQQAQQDWQFQQTFGEGARQFDLTTAEGQRQFNATFGEQARQFDLTTAEGRRQFDLNFGEQARQYDRTLAQQESEFGRTLGEQQRQFNTSETGYLYGANGQPTGTTLSREQQAFQQQQAQAEMAANPRNYVQALMTGARGGINGAPPVNALAPTTALGAAQAQTALNAQPQTNAVGQYIPTNSFQQALLTGQVVPNSGNIQTAGQWWNAQNLQQGFNPNQIRTQDYMRGSPDEQATFQSIGSFAGWSPEALDAQLRRNLPRFEAPTSGAIR
jgi:hypothetical protein